MTDHWALPLIGKPYADAGEGPKEFNCWGLVRWCFSTVRGITMPLIRVNLPDADQEEEIRSVTAASGWRKVKDSLPKDWDITLMHGPYGRHVGLTLLINGMTYLLHSIEGVGVTLTPVTELWLLGYKNITNWRQEA